MGVLRGRPRRDGAGVDGACVDGAVVGWGVAGVLLSGGGVVCCCCWGVLGGRPRLGVGLGGETTTGASFVPTDDCTEASQLGNEALHLEMATRDETWSTDDHILQDLRGCCCEASVNRQACLRALGARYSMVAAAMCTFSGW